MRSPSASRSEGEYLSSDSEHKATRPASRAKDNPVNRHSRTNSRYSRSRSRSPYRASRGEKRRRGDEYRSSRHDPRTFKVKYEDDRRSRYDYHGDRKPKRSRTHSPSRSRSRSRSPFRHGKEPGSGAASDSNQESVSTRVLKSDKMPYSETTAKLSEQTPDRSASSDQRQDVTSAADPTSTPAYVASHADADSVAMDEAAIIEARRRRREAIKNQYKNHATPLLVQALKGGPDTPIDSGSTTPTRPDSSASAAVTSPGSPGLADLSAPQSPIVSITKDSGSPNDDMFGSPKHEDEPSAADYDPTADMQDERARHHSRLFKEDARSEDNASQQVREQSNVSTEPVPEKKAELDMFAEGDDDDDMFAEESVSKPKPVESAAKTLHEGLMDNWDDAEGYYLTNLREKIDDRYEVIANLGRGMFASVVRARDTKSKDGRMVALKIIRNNDSMRKAGMKEVDILKDLAANDPDDRKHVVRLLRSFEHKGHLCMVFENLDMNLREVLKKFGRDIGLNLKAIRAYAQQLFLGLSLLRKCQYLHADLKPDNILADESRMKIKIADLGSASPITENATAPYLVSRFYRAPEVILGIDYDYGIDMWSTGCTLFELYTGKILFTGRNNNNMLKAIMECRGKFPHKLLRKGTLAYEYFDDLLNFKAQEQDKVTGRIITKVIDIKAKPVRDLKSRLMPKDKKLNEQDRKELESFADLLDKCLDLRPDKRITPTEALKHPFITRMK